MSRHGSRSRLLTSFVLAAFVLVTGSLAAQAPPASADPKFLSGLQLGEEALRTRKWQDALEAFRTANALVDKKSAKAYYGIARSFQGLQAFKSAADACREGLKYVADDERLAAALHNQFGMALYAQADKNTDKVIKEAEAEFRAALELRDAPPVARYNLGLSLLKQSRDDEGIAVLKTYVDSGAKTREVDLARAMIENPRRARDNFAPPFSLTTLQGEFFNNKELEGKVVFLDFWGQWCPPCRALTPDLVKLNKKYKDNPKFVMIGVALEDQADVPKWKAYIDQFKMDWPQFHDARRQVIAAFEITAYPTSVVIGPDGVVLLRHSGGSIETTRIVEDAIKKGLKMLDAK